MAKMELHKTEYPVLDADYYEASIASIEEVKNRFYDPNNTDPEKRGLPTQFKVRFEISRAEGQRPVFVDGWVNPVISRKSKLAKLCSCIFPDFTLAYQPDTNDFAGKKLRLNIGVKDRDDGTKTNIILDYAPLKKA